VRDALVAGGWDPAAIEIVTIRTAGDRIRDRPLAEAGGKGLFTLEIEERLLARDVDLAVHSAKDMETFLAPGLVIAAYLKREDARDALISRHGGVLDDLPHGALIGSASVRREALLRRARPDLRFGLLRGNVPTRLARVEAGDFDATLLAAAGLNRLGLRSHISVLLPLDTFPPACGQGAIAIECRDEDTALRDLLASVDDRDTSFAVTCERAFLSALGGSCRTPIAAHARIEGGTLNFAGAVLSPDGIEIYETTACGDPGAAAKLGTSAGEDVKRRAPAQFLSRIGIG
jgi:hydroxymethylbilane synthase